jgi:prevent-host-death family protein
MRGNNEEPHEECRRRCGRSLKVDVRACHCSISYVKDTYSVSEIGRHPAQVLRRAEQRGSVTVCRNGRIIGFVVSRDRMEAILETLEIMADNEAMKAIHKYQAGEARFKDVRCLDED